MTPAEARWIADVVLTRGMLKAYSPRATCPCQGGVCHHCRHGHTTRCVVVAWGGAPGAVPEGWITDRRGLVVGPAVWRAGRPCRWVCACTSCPQLPAPPPAAAPSALQLDIFGALLGGVS